VSFIDLDVHHSFDESILEDFISKLEDLPKGKSPEQESDVNNLKFSLLQINSVILQKALIQ